MSGEGGKGRVRGKGERASSRRGFLRDFFFYRGSKIFPRADGRREYPFLIEHLEEFSGSEEAAVYYILLVPAAV